MVEKNPHFKFSISSQKSGPVSDFHNSLRITAQECQQGLKYSGSHMAPASSVHGFGIKDDKNAYFEGTSKSPRAYCSPPR